MNVYMAVVFLIGPTFINRINYVLYYWGNVINKGKGSGMIVQM